MKITLNASIKEHREIAELVDSEDLSIIKKRGKFAFYIVDESTEKGFVIKDEIILHLDKAPLDLRMAIGTGIEFSLKSNPMVWYGRVKGSFIDLHKNIWCDFEEGALNSNSVVLCPDYLKSVGVEVEE